MHRQSENVSCKNLKALSSKKNHSTWLFKKRRRARACRADEYENQTEQESRVLQCLASRKQKAYTIDSSILLWKMIERAEPNKFESWKVTQLVDKLHLTSSTPISALKTTREKIITISEMNQKKILIAWPFWISPLSHTLSLSRFGLYTLQSWSMVNSRNHTLVTTNCKKDTRTLLPCSASRE